MLNQRDIVLIPIPFTDLESYKKRPALIISNNDYNKKNEDIVVVAITSNIEPRDFAMRSDVNNGHQSVYAANMVSNQQEAGSELQPDSCG